MQIEIKNRDVLWGYLAQFLNIGVGVLILPVILRKLPSQELGIWYIFLAISNLVYLLDFGFLPTIQRNISYVFSGAQELKKEGISEVGREVNYQLLNDLIAMSKKLYRKVSMITLIICMTFGNIYIYSLSKNLENSKEIIISWLCYILSIILNFYYYYFNALLRGRGLIGEANKIMIVSKIGLLIITIFFLNLNYGLLSLTFGNLVSVVITRILSYRAFYTNELKEKLKDKKVIDKNLFEVILYNSKKIGLVSLGAFLILRGNTFIASKYLSLEIVGKYGLTLQIYGILGALSSMVFQTFIPKFSQYRLENNNKSLKELYSFAYLINILIYIFGVFFISLLAPKVLEILGTKTKLLDIRELIFIGIYLCLEVIHSNAAGVIATKNVIPYVKPSICSGIGIIVLSIILIKYFKLGLWGLLLSQFIVQLSYNNWKWPLEVNKELGLNSFTIFILGINKLNKVLKGEKI
ncbi:Polysaccharide biosynthesis protein [Fusobacterium necrogenes]|uniref:Polysaccharide biosynthesis protein n=1 Tax=Fusobacterium necrogenes TaxID=858 RepID=A0A377GZ69_9FUSO|nr:O-unit flippase-like protein [Fusobacterium necrogenes]STO32279.1 Polysaccharide biosynthesis protein [Fusobacterium necrogenes]